MASENNEMSPIFRRPTLSATLMTAVRMKIATFFAGLRIDAHNPPDDGEKVEQKVARTRNPTFGLIAKPYVTHCYVRLYEWRIGDLNP